MNKPGNLLAFFSLFGILGLSAIHAKPLKVFILCGQSNMEGHAKISTFEAMKTDPLTKPILKEMIDGKGVGLAASGMTELVPGPPLLPPPPPLAASR